MRCAMMKDEADKVRRSRLSDALWDAVYAVVFSVPTLLQQCSVSWLLVTGLSGLKLVSQAV